MAATSQPLATLAAIEILKAGGNAVDAAIAANAVLAVTEPMSCGLGGDLFAIVWDAKTKKLYGLNASGRSPRGLTLEEFQRRKLRYVPERSPLTVSVPGCVDGWAELHKRFGKLPLEKVLAPAIQHARDGFAVTEVIARHWAVGPLRRGDRSGQSPPLRWKGAWEEMKVERELIAVKGRSNRSPSTCRSQGTGRCCTRTPAATVPTP